MLLAHRVDLGLGSIKPDEGRFMRKMILIAATAMCIGAITITAPNNAQARFGAEAMATAAADLSSAQPVRNSRTRRYPGYNNGAYGAYGSAYGAYQPSPYYNYWYNAPAPIYSGSREALDTCYYC